MKGWRRWARAPALHFVVLGGALYAADPWLAAPPPPEPRSGRTDQEILLEEALAVGIDRTDPFVRERLVKLAQFVEADGGEDAAHLEREARRLGLTRHDLVVRRHLVQVMELALARGGRHEWPDDAALTAFIGRHRARFEQPARLRFSHVFLARDRLPESAEAVAASMLERLRRDAPTGVPPPAMGDGFLAGSEITASEPEVARTFGPAFGAAVVRVPVGRWAGPVPSSYGLHLVWVHERTSETLPPLDAIRSRVVHAVLAEQAAARLERRLAERRAR